MCKQFVWARPSMVLRRRCKAQEMGVIQYAWSAFEMQRILNAICCYQEWHIRQWLLQFASQPAHRSLCMLQYEYVCTVNGSSILAACCALHIERLKSLA